MFGRVLKRLCPCYFGRTCRENDIIGYDTVSKETTDFRHISSEKTAAETTNSKNVTTLSSAAEEAWKGTLNTVQPQPIYAFPFDSKSTTKKNQKSLLKPPLYWKKTKKNLFTEGPPVFQLSKKEEITFEKDELKKVTSSFENSDISLITLAATVEVEGGNSRYLKLNDRNNHYNAVATIDSSAFENMLKDWDCQKCDISHGILFFTAAFFNKKRTCVISIDRLENLSTKGKDRSAYYTIIKISILPSEKYIKCTKVLQNCSSPEVKEDFNFSVKELSGRVLRLSVFDASLQKQHEAVGHALLTMNDIICNQPKKYCIKLFRRTRPYIFPGTIALSLKYCSDEDKLTIAIHKAKKLSLQRDKNGKLNTYVKVTMYAFGEKVKTKKSVVVFDCRDPTFNSTFTFQIRHDQIDHVSVVIATKLKGFVHDITIGRLNFGPFFYFGNQELTHWGRVFLKKEVVRHWFHMYL